MSERVVIYVYGFFDSPKPSEWPSAQQWVDDIIASDFTHVILASFHVDTEGNLYGSAPVVTDGALASGVNPQLPALYQQLAAAGKQVLYSIGNAAGSAGDLANLYTILQAPGSPAYTNLQTNLGFVKNQMAMVGIDFDFEGPYGSDQQWTVTQFTNFVDDLGLIVTYCPYTFETFWVDAQNAATAAVSWWNLQVYGGADPNQWATGLNGAKGVPDPAAFLVAGYSIDGGATPSQVQASISQAATAVPGLGGAFIWQMADIETSSGTYTVSDYAQAVINGLASESS
jgi:hypothetical protein